MQIVNRINIIRFQQNETLFVLWSLRYIISDLKKAFTCQYLDEIYREYILFRKYQLYK